MTLPPHSPQNLLRHRIVLAEDRARMRVVVGDQAAANRLIDTLPDNRVLDARVLLAAGCPPDRVLAVLEAHPQAPINADWWDRYPLTPSEGVA